MLNLTEITKNQLCLGCGLCECFIPNCKMIVNDSGFIVPSSNSVVTDEIGKFLDKICPAINIDCVKYEQSIFGTIKNAYEGWSNNQEIRHKASSGGVISALCCYLLKNNLVDGIIQVRKSLNHYMFNEIHVSTSEEDIIQSASSRYAPVSMFKNIKQLLEQDPRNYAFVGKPCDIMTITRLANNIPEWKNRIKFKISLVCAGTPSYNATSKLIKRGRINANSMPIGVKYRGNGWPGNFRVDYSDDSKFEMNYNESWGKVLGRDLNFRCKICPDGMGQYADVVVGDSWDTKNGYPDFTERDGKSFVLVRTTVGNELISGAKSQNYITIHDLDLIQLKLIQPYQYQRLEYASYKLLGAKICVGSQIKVKNIRLPVLKACRGFRMMLGTIKRFKRK